MDQQEKSRRDGEECEELATVAMTVVVVAAGLVAGIVWLSVYIARHPLFSNPYYMESVTGADGLNQLQQATTLSPVFNLTVRIDNADNSWNRACIPGLSTAVVSYGDAFLGKGSVPPFCAQVSGAQERAATAWGQDVALPRFLRERLSRELERGEAAVDVQVAFPARCSDCSDWVLVCSKVKIGGGSSPCRQEHVYVPVRPEPAAGSGSSS